MESARCSACPRQALTSRNGVPPGTLADRSEASGSEEPLEEGTVALEGVAKVVGGDVVTPVPVALQPSPLIGEGPGQVLHELGDQGVGLLDGPAWPGDE